MSDRIVVMRNGVIEQDGTPREIYEEPKTCLSPVLSAKLTALTQPSLNGLMNSVRASVEGRECNIYVNFAVEPGQN